MSFLQFQGTMMRAQYWAATIGLGVVNVVVNAIPAPLVDLILSVPLTWLSLCVLSARLRDAGWSLWLMLVFFVPLVFVFRPVAPELFFLAALVLLALIVVLGIVPTRQEEDALSEPQQNW